MALKLKVLYAVPAVWHVVKKNDSQADRLLDYGAGLRQCAQVHPIHFYPRLAGILWLLLSGLVLAAPAAPGTNYLIRGWQIESGLPQNKLTALLQAPDGYVYIGTASGLVRFDGIRFRVFDNQSTPALKNSRVTCLYESPDHTLWIGHENGGVTLYRNGRFEALPIRAAWPSKRLYAITADAGGEVWLMNESGLLARVRDGLVVSPATGTARRLLALARTTDGAIWVARDGRLSVLAGGQIHPAAFNESMTNRYDYVQGIGASLDGGLWVASNGHLRKWKDGKLALEVGAAPWGLNALTCLQETRSGILVAGTSNQGFFMLFPGTDQPPLHFNHLNGCQVDWIRSVAEDEEGDLWVSTGQYGLLEMRLSHMEILAPPDRWRGRAVLSVCPGQNGELWIGTEGAALYRYRDGDWRNFGYTNGLGNSYVWSVAVDGAGAVWAGNWGAGLYVLQGDRFAAAPGWPRVPPNVPALLAARDGGLWVGTSEGLLHYAKGQTNWEEAVAGPSRDDVRAMVEDGRGAVWFGTAGHGLACLEQGRLRRYTEADGLPGDYIECLHFTRDGNLWLGTFGGGLGRLKAGRCAVIGRDQGLPNSVIGDIEEDANGYLWMSSHGGILRASLAELNACADGQVKAARFLAYGVNDGLPTMECAEGLQPAGAKTADGRLWFPTSKGLVVVDPNAVIVNLRPPPMALEEVLVDGLAVTNTTAPWRVPPGRNHFEFHYTGLSLVAPEKVTFKYRLEGLETDWVDAGTKRVANYSFLPPGNYNFHVIAANNDGVWNETGLSLPFTLLPHFWQTWWFQGSGGALTVAVASSLVWFDTRRRMRRRLEKLEQQQAIERERARIAKDIHDDLGASLTRITMLSQTLQDPRVIPGTVAANLERIHDTARELTRSMDEIVWAVNPQHDTLDSLAGYLSRFAYDFLSAAGVRCRLDFPLQVPARLVTAEVRHNLFLAFKETLHNVARHAAATEVCVTLRVETNQLALVVTDNGRGFDPAQTPECAAARADRISQGNGLGNIRRRLAEIQSGVRIDSARGRGTTVTFTVPMRGLVTGRAGQAETRREK